jgi:dihydrofolate reductase
MAKLRVHNLSMSLDGFIAGPDEGVDKPHGIGGEALHDWAFATRTARRTHGMGGGAEGGLDEDYVARGEHGNGATIMGGKMFSPVRGPWKDDGWRGWWGDDPPFHHPVFVDPMGDARGSTPATEADLRMLCYVGADDSAAFGRQDGRPGC